MRIGDLAARTGVSVRALRYYEQQGLISAARTPAGQRVYPEAAVERVALIRMLLAAGLPSRTIVDILPCTRTGGISQEQRELLSAELDRIDHRIRALSDARDQLATLIATAPTAYAAGAASQDADAPAGRVRGGGRKEIGVQLAGRVPETARS
jgi:DNA-binding transcriptional MerR regulator